MELVFASMADVYALLVTVVSLVIAVNESISRRRVCAWILPAFSCCSPIESQRRHIGRTSYARALPRHSISGASVLSARLSVARSASTIVPAVGCAAAVSAFVWTAGRDLIARYQHHARTSVRHMVFA